MKKTMIIPFSLLVIGFSLLFSGCLSEKPESVLEKADIYFDIANIMRQH